MEGHAPNPDGLHSAGNNCAAAGIKPGPLLCWIGYKWRMSRSGGFSRYAGHQKRCGFAVEASESLDKRQGESPWANTEAAAWIDM